MAADLLDSAHAPGGVWRGTVEERLRQPHEQQAAFVDSELKRKVVRAGRRGGKTVGVALLAVRAFLVGRRVLYGVPTQEQVDRFWSECKRALEPAIDQGIVYKNETRHILEILGTETRIRAKTAWDADSLRGDYADLLILDEYQLMNEDAWGVVGAPMLLDNNGDAVFVYTPPSFRTAGRSKAHDPRHAAKLYTKAEQDVTGRWAAFHFASHDNPYISVEALTEITGDMTPLAHRQEILAEDVDEVPGALWTREGIEATRLGNAPPLVRIVIGVDPATSPGGETGIVVCGRDKANHGYVLEDCTTSGDPAIWVAAVIRAYVQWRADLIVPERNNGGAMVAHVIRQTTVDVDGETIKGANLPIETVWASRGKYTRAEPISVLWHAQEGHPPRAYFVGAHPALEDQCCLWVPGDDSPNNLDAMVWAMTELMLGVHAPTVAPSGLLRVSPWMGGEG